MAFTKIAAAGIGSTGTVTLQNIIVTGSVSTPSITGAASTENVKTNSLVVSGVTTSSGGFVGNVTGNATGLSGTPNITVGSIIASSATISGNVSVAGTLTYEDVTNIDSIGVVTARSGLVVSAGGANITGVVTATSFSGSGANLTGIAVTANVVTNSLVVSGVSTFNNNVKLDDNVKILFGTGIDLEIFHDGSDSYIRDIGTGDLKVIGANLTLNSDTVNINNAANTENLIRAFNNGAVNLYYDNSTRLETYSSGIIVSGGRITGADGSNFTMSVGTAHNLEFRTNDTHRLSITSSGHTEPALDNTYNLGSSSYRWSVVWGRRIIGNGYGSLGDYGGLFGQIRVGADQYGNTIKVVNDTNLNITANNAIYFNTGAATNGTDSGTTRAYVSSTGFLPNSDNTYDLGSSSLRWRNIYTADLQMSNEGSQNDIDGTWGKYTIQEGENDLFLINRRTGKKYKFLLEEVK